MSENFSNCNAIKHAHALIKSFLSMNNHSSSLKYLKLPHAKQPIQNRRKTRKIKYRPYQTKTQQHFPSSQIDDICTDINKIKNIQKQTNTKIETILDLLTQKRQRKIEKANNFEIIQKGNQTTNHHLQLQDYFSFKIKKEISRSSSLGARKNTQNFDKEEETEKQNHLTKFYNRKCISPEKRINHKYFEDTENYQKQI